MKKLIYLFMLIIPLSAQEAKDDPFHASVGKETKQEETVPQKVVRHIQDTEWRKFQAAHRRAHSKRGEEHSVRVVDKRKEMGKKHKIRQAVRLVVVGGLAYYIGYHQGEEHFNGGWDRRKDWSDRK
jgi:hypothetical protein